jgi:hypothetical protein
MSDYLEGQIRAHIFRTASFTKPTVLAVALCTSTPSDVSTGATIVEPPDANGYDRQTLNPLDANWTAASATDGLTDNAAAITFGPCINTNWSQVTHVAILDNATYGAGNVLFWGALDTPRTVTVGDSLTFAIGALNVTFA